MQYLKVREVVGEIGLFVEGEAHGHDSQNWFHLLVTMSVRLDRSHIARKLWHMLLTDVCGSTIASIDFRNTTKVTKHLSGTAREENPPHSSARMISLRSCSSICALVEFLVLGPRGKGPVEDILDGSEAASGAGKPDHPGRPTHNLRNIDWIILRERSVGHGVGDGGCEGGAIVR